MPADAVAGLLEAVIGLVMAIVEGFLLLIELVVEAIFLLIELLLRIRGKRRHLDRPDWVAHRRNSAASRVKSLVLAGLIVAAACFGAFQYWGFTRIGFFSGGFVRPDGVTVRLIRDGVTGYASKTASSRSCAAAGTESKSSTRAIRRPASTFPAATWTCDL